MRKEMSLGKNTFKKKRSLPSFAWSQVTRVDSGQLGKI